MPYSFHKRRDSEQKLGRTPRSARVPQDPLFFFSRSSIYQCRQAGQGPAADQGVRPTDGDDVR